MLILEVARGVPWPETEVHGIDDEGIGKEAVQRVEIGVHMVACPRLVRDGVLGKPRFQRLDEEGDG